MNPEWPKCPQTGYLAKFCNNIKINNCDFCIIKAHIKNATDAEEAKKIEQSYERLQKCPPSLESLPLQ